VRNAIERVQAAIATSCFPFTRQTVRNCFNMQIIIFDYAIVKKAAGLQRFKAKQGLRSERDWKLDVGDGALNRSKLQPQFYS
jgi:hypothetical protein